MGGVVFDMVHVKHSRKVLEPDGRGSLYRVVGVERTISQDIKSK
jgi:hypothetical protein